MASQNFSTKKVKVYLQEVTEGKNESQPGSMKSSLLESSDIDKAHQASDSLIKGIASAGIGTGTGTETLEGPSICITTPPSVTSPTGAGSTRFQNRLLQLHMMSSERGNQLIGKDTMEAEMVRKKLGKLVTPSRKRSSSVFVLNSAPKVPENDDIVV